jgi:iron(III) transport system substrate-binding protein
MSRTGSRNQSAGRASISRREALRRAALGLGAVALLGAEPALAAPLTIAEQGASTGRATSPSFSAPPTVRQGMGTVTIYSALNESTNNAFTEAFKASMPGIDTAVLPLAAAGELQTRIQTEKDAPKCDVFIGGDQAFHDALGKQGLLEQYISPNAATVAPAYKDPDGFWTGWYIGIFGLVVNKDRWASEMADKPRPTTWDDLIQPGLTGQVMLPDPVKTGGGYIFLADQVFRFGRDEEKALDYMKALHANVGQYVASSPLGIELVAQGQFLIGANWGHDILTAASKGQPVEFIAPKQTANEIGGVSIVKGGPNSDGAKMFVDWVLSPEGSALNVKLSNRLSVLPSIPPAPGAPTLDEVDMVDYDRPWAADNKDRLIKAWQSAVGM